MIVSGSELATLNECEMQYYYKYVLKLYPKDESAAIMTGNYGHENMQQFFLALQKGATKEEALKEIVPIASNEMAIKASLLAHKFCSEFNTSSGHPEIVEEQYVFPLQGIFKIGLTPDLVWKFKSGKYALYDWKFTGRTWSNKAADMHYQLPSYKEYLEQNLGIEIRSLNYVFFNTKSSTEFKYKIYQIVMSNRESGEIVEDQKKALERVHALRSNPKDWAHDHARRVNNKNTCDYCPFQVPCRMDRKGKSATGTLNLMYRTNDFYGYDE